MITCQGGRWMVSPMRNQHCQGCSTFWCRCADAPFQVTVFSQPVHSTYASSYNDARKGGRFAKMV